MNFDLPELDQYRSIWLAVLQQAIADLVTENVEEEIASRTARRWFKSDADGVGSFNWVCNVVNLERESVLQRVREKLREHDGAPFTKGAIHGLDGRSRVLGLRRRPA